MVAEARHPSKQAAQDPLPIHTLKIRADRPEIPPTCHNGPMSEPNQLQAGQEVALLTTNLGTITVRFFEDKAPNHVANFKKLAREGFYDGTKFHRVIPGFMVQGGCPNTRDGDRSTHGMGGPKERVKAEFNDVKHVRGVLSAARTQDPNSAGSQFFLMVKDSPHLDGQYSAYGQVLEGMDVVDKIVNLPRDGRDNPLPVNPAILEKVEILPWMG